MKKMLQFSTAAIVICAVSSLALGCFTMISSNASNSTPVEQLDTGIVTYGGNLQRTSTYNATGVRQFHEVAWTFGEPLGGLCLPAIVYQAEVYLSCGDGAFHAIDVDTGKEKWKLEDVPIDAPPMLANGILYFGSASIHHIDETTSKWNIRLAVVDPVARMLKAEFKLGNFQVETTPAIVGRIIYFITTDGTLYAVDAATGNESWHFDTPGSARHSSGLAVANGIVYFVNYDEDHIKGGDVISPNGHLYAVDTQTGKELWKFPTNNGNSPVIAGGLVLIYTGVTGGFLVALDATTGAEKWRVQGVTGPPAVADGVVYIGGTGPNGATSLNGMVTQDGYLQALDIKTGQQKWKIDVDGGVAIKTSPSIADGVIYFWSGIGSMQAIDLTTNRQLWSYTPSDLAVDKVILIDFGPIITNGMVFFTSFDKVYAVR